jgi:Zn/Cd-binding protein ZinT
VRGIQRAGHYLQRAQGDIELERGSIFESEQLHAIESKNAHIEFINGSFQPSSVKEQQISEVLRAWKARMGALQDAHFDRTDPHSKYIVSAHIHMSGQMNASTYRFVYGALGVSVDIMALIILV